MQKRPSGAERLDCLEASVIAFLALCVLLAIGLVCATLTSKAIPFRGLAENWPSILRAIRETRLDRRLGGWAIAGLVIVEVGRTSCWGVLVVVAVLGFLTVITFCSSVGEVLEHVADYFRRPHPAQRPLD